MSRDPENNSMKKKTQKRKAQRPVRVVGSGRLVRRFRKRGGFEDATAYLEHDGKDTWLVRKDGSKRREAVTQWYSLAYCESQVKTGVWIELRTPNVADEGRR